MDNNQSPVEEKKVPNWIVRLPDDSDMDYLGRIVTYMAEESPDMHQIMESWQIVAGRDWKRTKIGRETIQGQRPILSLSATDVPPKPLCDEATIKAWFQIVGRVDYFLDSNETGHPKMVFGDALRLAHPFAGRRVERTPQGAGRGVDLEVVVVRLGVGEEGRSPDRGRGEVVAAECLHSRGVRVTLKEEIGG